MPPPGQAEIEREELSGLFGHMVGARLVAAPAIAIGAIWLAVVEPAPWRRVALGAVAILAPAFFLFEWLRYRRSGFTERAVPLNLAVASVGHALLTFASGGLSSPILYLMVPLGILAGVFLRPRTRAAVLAFQVAIVWASDVAGVTGVIPDFNLSAFGGGARVGGPPSYLHAQATFITFVLLMAGSVGRAVRWTMESIIRRGLAAQQEALRAHSERAEQLTALSGEIAHELKNPLASVKGLASLLSQQLPDGKGAERLGVLRREVDRMQSVLDEFLNFSRPLVPLALGEVDVGALCHDVAALHEGIARERGVEVTVRGGEVRARCDPRKMKQVLINLVQNALDASPPGSSVEIDVRAAPGGGAVARVLDRGRGIDPAVGDAIFSPGVTTKPRGSGLGLTIARAVARQHGGELSISPRPGGGTAAEVALPGAGDRPA